MRFFDSREPFPEPGIADVDRVYPLVWSEFDDCTWEALDAVYRQLPGWCGYPAGKARGWRGWLGHAECGCPFWFGTNEKSIPHLTASVEPPGLQVTGRLADADFQMWHQQFLIAVAEFPNGEPN